jgi:hypothetical protein
MFDKVKQVCYNKIIENITNKRKEDFKMSFAKCEYHECLKKETCVRYKEAKESVVEYKHLCSNYEWYIPMVVELKTTNESKT